MIKYRAGPIKYKVCQHNKCNLKEEKKHVLLVLMHRPESLTAEIASQIPISLLLSVAYVYVDT